MVESFSLFQRWEILTEEDSSMYQSNNQLVSPSSRTPGTEFHSFYDELRNILVMAGEMPASQTVSHFLCSIRFYLL